MATRNSDRMSVFERFERYQPTKSILAWCSAAAVALTLIVGFSWGGWVTGGEARAAAATAAEVARGELASDICVERFNAAPDVAARLAELKAATTASARRQFVEAGGWATMPGQTSSDRRGTEACATALVA